MEHLKCRDVLLTGIILLMNFSTIGADESAPIFDFNYFYSSTLSSVSSAKASLLLLVK